MPSADLKPESVPPPADFINAGSCSNPTETALGVGAVMHRYFYNKSI